MTDAIGRAEWDEAAAIRAGAGVFGQTGRGLIEVTGEDRVRWLGGMVSGDVEALAAGPDRSGCYALLLTPQGRIIADLHVILRPEAFWLEVAGDAATEVEARLDRYVIADDVSLRQRGDDFARLGLEGPEAGAILGRAACGLPELGPECALEIDLAGVPVVAAAFGWTGEQAFQLFGPAGSEPRILEALREADAAGVLVEGSPQTLELMRIEAGTPLLGPELDETVLPPEAHLERAISTTKGCYTGQEVVARLRSRGQVAHSLVGLRLEGVSDAELSDLSFEGRRVGEVTSRTVSGVHGDIALGYVRRAQSEPGTLLAAGNGRAVVSSLPFGTETTGSDV